MPTSPLPFVLPLSAPRREDLPDVARHLRTKVGEHTNLAALQRHLVEQPAGAHRLALVAGSPQELQDQLEKAASGEIPGGAGASPEAGIAGAPRVALLFTGQGAQYAGMGRDLYQGLPVFRAELDAVVAALGSHLPSGLLPVILGEEGAGAIDHTAWTQPSLFAIELALARLWMRWGIQPVALIGHSIGELAAACLAGVFSLEDGARLVAARGRLMGELPPGGAMVAFRSTEETVQQAILALTDEQSARLSIAGINAPDQVVVSGEEVAVSALERVLRDRGLKGSRLSVSHAFHSPLMEPMLLAFHEVAALLELRPPQIPLVSNLSGRMLPVGAREPAEPGYWVRHVRDAVRFADGMAALGAHGVDLLLEVGPHPVLSGLARSCGVDAEALPSLRKKREDGVLIARSLAALWAAGAPVDWARITQG